MNHASNNGSSAAAPHGLHKYITFKLASEEYGIELLKLRELIGVLEITRIPRSKPYIRGLINLRGKVIPVVDLRAKFGMQTTEITSQSVIIVVQLGASGTTGLLVDEVLEVRAIPDTEIEPPPSLDDRVDISFIRGVGKVESRIVFLLDIDRVLNAEQQSEVHTLTDPGPATDTNE